MKRKTSIKTSTFFLSFFLFLSATLTVSANALGSAEAFLTITGTLTSDDGEPLIGATVLVKGTDKGTITDLEGKYSIEANEDDVLIYSFTGFATQEIPVGGRAIIDVVLSTDVAELSEIVVTGYSSQKKANLTGAVGVIDAEALDARPITNATQALQGQVSGVWINQNIRRTWPGCSNNTDSRHRYLEQF